VSSDLSILDLFINASLLVQAIMGFLVIASLISWTIIFQRARHFKKAASSAVSFENRFWSGV